LVSVGFGQTSTGGFAEALVYGADNGAQISSNSWGYISSGVVEQAVLDAIDYYTDSASDGGEGIEGIVVFAAGNDNSNADYYPGFYPKTVAVAATDNSGSRASFSNYGGPLAPPRFPREDFLKKSFLSCCVCRCGRPL